MINNSFVDFINLPLSIKMPEVLMISTNNFIYLLEIFIFFSLFFGTFGGLFQTKINRLLCLFFSVK